MTLEKSIRTYVHQQEIMQLATERDGQPWCSSLHYVADDELNIYWLSFADRRHSEELKDNPKAAIAIAVQPYPPIGVQVEGDVEQVANKAELEKVAKMYNDRFVKSEEWLKDFIQGNNDGFRVYKLKPRLFVLFDRVSHPKDFYAARQEWRPLR